jgi:cullin 3
MMLRGSNGSMSQCNWPAEIQGLQASFFKYYNTERNGRVLTWAGNLGTADIKCVFPKIPGKETGLLSKERRYELTVSTHGMVVLMLFNELPDGEWLGFEEIQAATNIPAPELSRTLASLSLAPKSRVLLKDPMTKTIKPDDRFTYNSSFTSKQVKIRAPIVSAHSKVEGDDERKETEKKNDQSRLAIVDAAIVRIMKYVRCPLSFLKRKIIINYPNRARKELAHNLLITEVVNVLSSRFKPDLPVVKKRIEDLIAREFLERAEDTDATQQVYRYLA